MKHVRWLKHAFAVEPQGPAQPTEDERPVVDRLCRTVVRRRMTTPVLMLLELGRPLSYLGSQTMHLLAPFVTVVTNPKDYQRLAGFFERRGAVDYLTQRIEQLESKSTDGAHERTVSGEHEHGGNLPDEPDRR